MNHQSAENELVCSLAERTDTRSEDWFLVFKARYGMQVIFDTLYKIGGEGCVVTQLFTCLTAVVPIIVSGLKPYYCDISSRTASLDPDRLELPMDTHAVMLQHTYGIIDDDESERLARQAHGAGALVVEDSAHCVCHMARTSSGDPIADISVHSFGIEKIMPTHFGGAVWINPASSLHEAMPEIREALRNLPPLSPHIDKLVRRYRLENSLLAHLPGPVSTHLRGLFVSSGLMEPAVSESERRGTAPYEPMGVSPWICSRVMASLAQLDELESVRRRTVEAYRVELEGVEGIFSLPAVLEGPLQPLLRYPVYTWDTATADRIVSSVCKAGLLAEAWYRPELSPGILDEKAFSIPQDRSAFPEHEHLVATCIALPADIGEDGVRRAVAAIRTALGLE